MRDGAWRPGGGEWGASLKSWDSGKPFPRPFYGDHQLGAALRGQDVQRGKERQALAQMQRSKVNRRVPVQER